MENLKDDDNDEFTVRDSLYDSTLSELICAAVVYVFASVFLVRVCDGPRFVVL